MQCKRLLNLTKSWYLSVKDETMAPARMIQFIKNHVASCEVCQADPDLPREIEKITEIILPESKIPKAVRLQQEEEEEAEKENIRARAFKTPPKETHDSESEGEDDHEEDDEYINDEDDDNEEDLLDEDFEEDDD